MNTSQGPDLFLCTENESFIIVCSVNSLCKTQINGSDAFFKLKTFKAC